MEEEYIVKEPLVIFGLPEIIKKAAAQKWRWKVKPRYIHFTVKDKEIFVPKSYFSKWIFSKHYRKPILITLASPLGSVPSERYPKGKGATRIQRVLFPRGKYITKKGMREDLPKQKRWTEKEAKEWIQTHPDIFWTLTEAMKREIKRKYPHTSVKLLRRNPTPLSILSIAAGVIIGTLLYREKK